MRPDTPTRVLVRWTVNAHGFRRGDQVLIDPTQPGMAELLNAQILIPEPAYRQAPTRDVQ